jgi:hypothetical protein
MSDSERLLVLCKRLTALGYAQHKKIRLYGEELLLISDPSPEGNGFAIEGIARKSGKVTRMRIPLPVVQVLKRELEVLEKTKRAA